MSALVKLIDRYLTKPLVVEERKHLFTLVEESSKARLLDCGCGDGEFTLKMAGKIGTKDVYGIDIMPEKLGLAKKGGIKVFKGNLDEKFPFPDESFDVILILQVIEHLHHTDAFLREIHRVLTCGGYIIIQTPNLASFYSILYLIFGKQPVQATVSDEILAGSWNPRGKYREANEGPQHRRIFTAAALRELLEYHGFKMERTFNIGFYPFPFPPAKVMSFVDKWHATTILMKAKKVSK